MSILKEKSKQTSTASTQATVQPLKSQKLSKSQKTDKTDKPDKKTPSKPPVAVAVTKPKRKILKNFDSNRERKGNRFNALRNCDLELQLYAEGDIDDDSMDDVVPETQLTPLPPPASSSNVPNKQQPV